MQIIQNNLNWDLNRKIIKNSFNTVYSLYFWGSVLVGFRSKF